jgi:hypothetical protein
MPLKSTSIISTTTYPLTTENLDLIFKDKNSWTGTHLQYEINIYSLSGKAKIIQRVFFSVDKVSPPIPKYILK